jgi:hypothetical protein
MAKDQRYGKKGGALLAKGTSGVVQGGKKSYCLGLELLCVAALCFLR